MKWFVPGRLEVLGKHTDYMGGRSLLAAVDRGITATLVGVETPRARFVVSTTAVPGELSLTPGVDPGLPAGHWGNYVQAALDRLALNFGELSPARITFDSNLPLASGMSSSSALVVATALAVVHRSAMIHRDIKPGNFVQINSPIIRIVDAGRMILEADVIEIEKAGIQSIRIRSALTCAVQTARPTVCVPAAAVSWTVHRLWRKFCSQVSLNHTTDQANYNKKRG